MLWVDILIYIISIALTLKVKVELLSKRFKISYEPIKEILTEIIQHFFHFVFI